MKEYNQLKKKQVIISCCQIVLLVAIIINEFYGVLGQGIYVVLIVLILLSAVSILLLKRLYEAIAQKTDYKINQLKLKQKENLIQELKSQKHDFSNHLQTVFSLVQLEKCEKAKEYIDSLNHELREVDTTIARKGTVLEAVVLPMKKEAEEEGIEFYYDFEEGIEKIGYSPYKLVRILSNLIENAIEATRQSKGKKRIEISGQKKPESYLISVKNTGPEITQEMKREIFKQGVSTKNDDRGFGLYIIKTLIEEKGGRLEVKSEADYGAKFMCYLPAEE